MKNKIIKLTTLIVLFIINQNILFAQEFTCHTPNSTNTNTTPPSNFAPQNNSICTDPENYIPNTQSIAKTIRLNFHYLKNSDPLNPLNFTETTGFSNTDLDNNGYNFADSLVAEINYQLNNNKKLNFPCNNTIPNFPIKIKVEIYKNPNIANDKGVYFHSFNNLFLPNGDINNASNFWYKGTTNYTDGLKTSLTFNQDKVIDVFIAESKNNDDGGGVACGYHVIDNASMALSDIFDLAKGNTSAMNRRDIISKSGSTFIHELGHILNLWHTFDEAALYGDGCLDTYLPPYNNPSVPTDGRMGCLVDSLCNPPNKMYMNNVMDNCGGHRGLSPCQIGIVHYFLETYNPTYLKCEYDPSETITIKTGSNITWKSSKRLNGDLILEEGAKLTILCDLFMQENAKVIINPKALLTVNGGRITKSCGGLWAGIFLLGNPTKPSNGTDQGVLRLMNGATIEYATKGVFVGGYWMNGNEPNYLPGKEGGLILAVDAFFKNCRKSVEYWPYHSITTTGIEIPNLSIFRNCEFINDAYLPNYDYTTPLTWGPEFVSMWDVQGIKFEKCIFKDVNSITYSPMVQFRTTALSSYGASYDVYDCQFFNLYTGIWAEASGLDPIDNVDVLNNRFDNTLVNITSVNQIGDRIVGNGINNIPSSYGNTNNTEPLNYVSVPMKSWGIYMKGSRKYLINDNSINSAYPVGIVYNDIGQGFQYPPIGNFGIIASNSGSSYASTIAENNITNVTTGIQTEDINDKLQIGCNNLKANQLAWHINPSSPTGSLVAQGYANGFSQGANNSFKEPCTGFNPQDINSHIRSSIAFNYNDDAANPLPPQVSCTTPNVTINILTGPNQPNCDQFPFIDTRGQVFYPIRPDLTGLNLDEKQKAVFGSIVEFSKTGDRATVIDLLKLLNTQEAGKMLIAISYAQKDVETLEKWLNNLQNNQFIQDYVDAPQNTLNYQAHMSADKTDYIYFYTRLLNALKEGRYMTSLQDDELLSLENIASNDTRAGLMAKGLITQSKKLVRRMLPETEGTIANRLANNTTNSTNEFVSYPNPFDNTISFNTQLPTNKKGIITIHDLTGKAITTISVSNNKTTINTSSWNIGLYTATLHVDGEANQTIKISKQ